MMKIVLMLFFGSSLYAQTVIDREKFAKVASIESFPASGEEKGIIFLIPQVHAHPIRGYDDDPYAIVAVQSQIDDILRVLSAEYGVKTVGLEGEGEGEDRRNGGDDYGVRSRAAASRPRTFDGSRARSRPGCWCARSARPSRSTPATTWSGPRAAGARRRSAVSATGCWPRPTPIRR